jgi:hypothetical protein
MARWFVTRQLPGPAPDRLAEVHEVEVWPGRLSPSPEQLCDAAADAEGLLTLLTDTVDEALPEAARHLQLRRRGRQHRPRRRPPARSRRRQHAGGAHRGDRRSDPSAAARRGAAAPRGDDGRGRRRVGDLGAGALARRRRPRATLGIVGMGRIVQAVGAPGGGVRDERDPQPPRLEVCIVLDSELA